MTQARKEDIIRTAKEIRKNWGDSPFEVANRIGAIVTFGAAATPEGSIFKVEGYPAVIRINGCNDYISRMVMCAHEIGHAIFHDTGVNRFDGTRSTVSDDTEYEANLFAVAYLFDDEDFIYPINEMSNYTLKQILDYNITA